MTDENVIPPVTPTEPAQVPVSPPPTTDVSGQAVVEIPATEPTPAPIQPAEPVTAPVAEPVPVIEPAPSPEPIKPVLEEPEIEIPEPVEQTTPATQPQAVSTPTEPKPAPTQGSGQAEPQVVEKIVYKEDPGIIRRLLDKAKSKIQERKRKKLDKIMSLFSILPQVTNKDVQKSLRVIKRTATRYLDQLEKEGKITQVGKTGKSVIYTKRP